MKALEICRRNAGTAKKTAVEDKAAWRREGKDLAERHPWIAEKKGELTEVFGPLGGITIKEKDKVWRYGEQHGEGVVAQPGSLWWKGKK